MQYTIIHDAHIITDVCMRAVLYNIINRLAWFNRLLYYTKIELLRIRAPQSHPPVGACALALI